MLICIAARCSSWANMSRQLHTDPVPVVSKAACITLTSLKSRLCVYNNLGWLTTVHRPTKKKAPPVIRGFAVLILLLSGDIETNPGPRAKSAKYTKRQKEETIYPCGLCEINVGWSRGDGIFCDNCDIWHHRSCVELCTADFSLLQRSHVQWLCCKCNHSNIESFTFHTFLTQPSYYEPISDENISYTSYTSFDPLLSSTPKKPSPEASSNHKSCNSSNPFHLQPKVNLRIMTINCRKIEGKTSEFKAAVDYIKPDVICGTESWLKKDVKSNEVFPSHFRAYRNDRGTLGGGVFILAHEDLISMEQPDLVTDCELSWTSIKTRRRTDLFVGSFYMPHREHRHLDMLDESLTKLMSKPRDVILAGDFNCPDVNWENNSVPPGAPNRVVQQQLVDIMVKHCLTQVHNQPTREDNILDLVFTTNESLLKSSTSIPGISDHSIVVTDMDLLPHYVKKKPRSVHQFGKADWDDMRKDSESISTKITDMHEAGANTTSLWETFTSKIHAAIKRNIPTKLLKPNNRPPWISRKIRRLLDKKRRLYHQACKTKNWSNYRNIQRICKRELRRAEFSYLRGTIENGLAEGTSRPFWSYIKSKKRESVGVAPLRKNGSLVYDSLERANVLVAQFKSVFTRDDNPPDRSRQPSYQHIKDICVTTPGVEKLLKNLKVSKAPGPDGIPNRVLQECAKELAPGIRAIFDSSITTGVLPKDWTNANVAPAFKKGNKHLPENYRPISLTSVVCKTLEHIVCSHLMKHLESQNILTNLNHGFRRGFSCETQLLTTYHDLARAYDKKQQIDVAILDFSKAFDTVPHARLLEKLHNYGITGRLNTWIENFLTNRHMSVIVEGERSIEEPVKSGVPQGTVLGPILFLCHINDLPEEVKSIVRLFADDCLLYRVIRSRRDHDALQEDLQKLELWAKKWGMRFNASKCYILSINPKSQNFYTLNDQILKHVQTNPYLGVTFSNDLKWSPHISKISKKASSTLGFLRRNLKFCPTNLKQTAYISMVRSTLEYGSSVWDPYSADDISRLERIQRGAARFITGNYKDRQPGCVTKMLEDLNLPSLQNRRQQNRLCQMYKVAGGLVPGLPAEEHLTEIRGRRKIIPKKNTAFVTSNPVTKFCRNNSRAYAIPPASCDQYKNSFFVKTVTEWNQLEDKTVLSDTAEIFRSRVSSPSLGKI